METSGASGQQTDQKWIIQSGLQMIDKGIDM